VNYIAVTENIYLIARAGLTGKHTMTGNTNPGLHPCSVGRLNSRIFKSASSGLYRA